MKLLHTSDWHLGITERGGISYRDDQQYMIDEICRIATDEKVDGILLAGDVFDKSIASSDAIKLLDETMHYICGTLDIPVYMIAGNHDGAERISLHNKLLQKSGLHIAGSLQREPQVISLKEVDIYLLPWISTDKVRSIYPEKEEEIQSLEDAYRVVLDAYRETFAEGKKHILVSHAFIVDAKTSVSDRAAEVGRATMIGSFVFDGFDYVALGHLHGPQQVGENIFYSGTPMAYSFGKEEEQIKSVVILDTDSMEKKIVPVATLRGRHTVKGRLLELLAGDYEKHLLDSYIRLEIPEDYVGANDAVALREIFPHLLEIVSKSFEDPAGKVTMTMEQLEEAGNNPEVVFKQFCMDIGGEVPNAHRLSLFHAALKAYEGGITNE